jgi:hypothetical protein
MPKNAPLAIAVLSTVMFASGAASAKNVEVVASFATMVPAHSPYRTAANGLGYADEGMTNGWEGEVGALFGVAYHDLVSVGPVLRIGVDRMQSRYGGLESIAADSGFAGLREEVTVFYWPRFFVWADESIGLGSVGTPGARVTLGAYGLRGGLGLRVGGEKIGARFRIGYSYAPTFVRVTDPTGGYDFGGFMFAIDGVIRVAH